MEEEGFGCRRQAREAGNALLPTFLTPSALYYYLIEGKYSFPRVKTLGRVEWRRSPGTRSIQRWNWPSNCRVSRPERRSSSSTWFTAAWQAETMVSLRQMLIRFLPRTPCVSGTQTL